MIGMQVPSTKSALRPQAISVGATQSFGYFNKIVIIHIKNPTIRAPQLVKE
jgi:hypothetical protein